MTSSDWADLQRCRCLAAKTLSGLKRSSAGGWLAFPNFIFKKSTENEIPRHQDGILIMKVFLAFFQSLHKHPIPAYSFWEYYLKNGIEEAGHTWSEANGVDWAAGLVPQTGAELNEWKKCTWGATV